MRWEPLFINKFIINQFFTMEEIEMYLEEARELMEKAIHHVNFSFSKIRAGKASPGMLDGIMVEYYGNATPLNQVSSINTPDARTIVIKPWEKKIIADIERAIINSDIGLNPQNDGELVRLNVPPLSEERRQQLVKQAKHEAEMGKVSIRNIRKDTNIHLKQLLKEHVSEDAVKRGEDEVQKLTDEYIVKIDEMLVKKEKDILTV
jgi:ribosome recycling factor